MLMPQIGPGCLNIRMLMASDRLKVIIILKVPMARIGSGYLNIRMLMALDSLMGI
jgi:hypothetical protein